ncbi:MAG: cytochrome P450, partial [Alphaproteobacteria bacterium]
HSKYRKLVSQGFTPRMTAQLEPKIRKTTAEILDRITPLGKCDFVRDVAAELPLIVIAELVGVPLEDRHKVFEWSNKLIGFDDPEFGNTEEVGKQAAAEIWLYANQLAEQRRKDPRDDLVSVLMSGEVDGEKLSEVDFDSFFLLLAVAGNETTRNLISGGMRALLEHPAEWQRLKSDPSLLNAAVEEMLRWVSPVNHFRRTVTRDTELRGQKLREGDKVVIWYPSANRDEDVFPNPMHFDVGRTPNNHVAFGIGEHFCLGANLARLEIRAIFDEVIRRMPDMEFAGPVRRLRSNFINGIKEMPVRFTPSPAVAA